jgi:mono/diheme cytochrome c family protein
VRRLRATPLLCGICLALLLGLAACGGDDDEAAETPATTTQPAETSGGGETDPGAAVFASAGCGNCHTLAAANASGTVGPNLDELMPDAQTVADQVTNGGAGMPAFGGDLSEQEIQDVANYVAENAGG